jgi:four helix bundle protein
LLATSFHAGLPEADCVREGGPLVLAVYRWTTALPPDERYVLGSQIRRSAVSIAANIVEGCARSSQGEYVNHLNVALGSAAELRYLLGLTGRLYPSVSAAGNLLPAQSEEVRLLVGLIASFQPDTLKPKA